MKIQKKTKNAKKDKDSLLEYNPTKKIQFRFDRSVFNMFIGYIYLDSPLISKLNLMNLNKLLDLTDERPYETNRELYTRMIFCKKSLEAKLRMGMMKEDVIISYARETNNEICDKLIANLDTLKQLNEDEIKFITESIADRLQYAFIMVHKEIISNVFYRLDTGDYKYMKDIVMDVKDACVEMMNSIRKAENKSSSSTFSLRPDVFETLVEDTVTEAANPSSVLITGLQLLNSMLSPGYMPGRLYLYLG
jgi:hypothetical protein